MSTFLSLDYAEYLTPTTIGTPEAYPHGISALKSCIRTRFSNTGNQVVGETTQALDKILSAYAKIGAALPRLSMLRNAFFDDKDFQLLFAFLYEDIMEFHTRAYKVIRKPGKSMAGKRMNTVFLTLLSMEDIFRIRMGPAGKSDQRLNREYHRD